MFGGARSAPPRISSDESQPHRRWQQQAAPAHRPHARLHDSFLITPLLDLFFGAQHRHHQHHAATAPYCFATHHDSDHSSTPNLAGNPTQPNGASILLRPLPNQPPLFSPPQLVSFPIVSPRGFSFQVANLGSPALGFCVCGGGFSGFF
jgi:hypothetical protein